MKLSIILDAVRDWTRKIVPTLTNNLSANVPGTALDATQGKVLNDKIAVNSDAISQINSDLMNRIGVLDKAAIDSIAANRNVKGMYQEDNGKQYIFIQIPSNYYSVQIIILHTGSTVIDRVAFRTTQADSTFANKDFVWLKTSNAS